MAYKSADIRFSQRPLAKFTYTYMKSDSSWNNQLLQIHVRPTDRVKPRARRTPATTPADCLSTVELELLLKAEGKMRKLGEGVSFATEVVCSGLTRP